MIGKNERQKDILRVVENLDITPTMYRNAEEKYKALADYLERHTDLPTTMYPQGSFAFGTVVRPIKNGKETSYDLDFICEVGRNRDEVRADELRGIIEDALQEGELYGGKMEVFDECVTIHYAEEGGVGFSIDIVPAAHESETVIRRLRRNAERPDLLDTAIAIPIHGENAYEWWTNNPKGFVEWFEEINRAYMDYARIPFRQALFESTDIYNSVEDIPTGLERSAVQRTIQLLKRHRDQFYTKFSELKPISAIINVLVADVAKGLLPDTDIFTLLEYVLGDAIESSKYYEDTVRGEVLLESRIIGRKRGGWYIANPANPEDNLASAWNNDPEIPKKFFRWVDAARHDLIDSMGVKDNEFRAITESAFGSEAVQKVWGDKYDMKKATPIVATVKPWRKR